MDIIFAPIPQHVLLDAYQKIAMPIDKLLEESDYLDLFYRQLPFQYQNLSTREVASRLKKLRDQGKLRPLHFTNR
jgi:hypothetical protein